MLKFFMTSQGMLCRIFLAVPIQVRALFAMPSHFAVLGVPKSADEEEIKRAFKTKAIETHPDKPGGSAELFRQVQRAYEVLRDKGARVAYIQQLKTTSRVNSFSMKSRPSPLDNVKQGVTFNMLDGKPYFFETAPDRFHSRFRHGDIVRGPSGEQGVIVGLAFDGVYWCRNNSGIAEKIFSPEFGGDRDVVLLFRDTGHHRASSRDREKELAAREQLRARQLGIRRRAVEAEEKKTRDEIIAAVNEYFRVNYEKVKLWETKCAPLQPATPLSAAPQIRLVFRQSASGHFIVSSTENICRPVLNAAHDDCSSDGEHAAADTKAAVIHAAVSPSHVLRPPIERPSQKVAPQSTPTRGRTPIVLNHAVASAAPPVPPLWQATPILMLDPFASHAASSTPRSYASMGPPPPRPATPLTPRPGTPTGPLGEHTRQRAMTPRSATPTVCRLTEQRARMERLLQSAKVQRGEFHTAL